MKFEFSTKFIKTVEKVNDSFIKSQLIDVLENIKLANKLDEISNLKKLKGHKIYFRIRLGNYRIGILYKNEILYLLVFEHRKDIYKKFP